jgi:hypothetical protein
LTDEVTNLFGFGQSSAGCIANCPACFFLRFEITMLQHVNKGRNEVRINDRLDLITVASGDIRNRPACFFPNGFFGAREKTQESRKSTAVDYNLSLNIISGDDIADRS